MSCSPRLRPLWIVVVCIGPWLAPAAVGARPGDDVPAAPAAAKSGRNKRARRKHGQAGKIDRTEKIGDDAPALSTAAHRRQRRHARPSGGAKHPTKLALVASPGPAQTPEARRAMDDVRHMQIERAASAARRDDVTNRWETVNFLISGVDEQHYPEAGFWKVLACYRRGRISEGDSVRQRCRLSAGDVRALDEERSVALLLTAKSGAAPAEPATLAAAAAGGPEGVINNAAYTGPGPTADPTPTARP